MRLEWVSATQKKGNSKDSVEMKTFVVAEPYRFQCGAKWGRNGVRQPCRANKQTNVVAARTLLIIGRLLDSTLAFRGTLFQDSRFEILKENFGPQCNNRALLARILTGDEIGDSFPFLFHLLWRQFAILGSVLQIPDTGLLKCLFKIPQDPRKPILGLSWILLFFWNLEMLLGSLGSNKDFRDLITILGCCKISWDAVRILGIILGFLRCCKDAWN